jgi:hypothetical protein
MTKRSMISLRSIAAILLLSGSGVQDLALAQSAPPGETAPAGWVVPRTSWGDPDLTGDYSNKYEQGTPLERPAEFEGRSIGDVNGDELAALIEQRGIQVILNAPFSGDPLAGNFGGAPAFYDQYEAGKGSRPWFVIDPPDGKIPPLTTSGRERAQAAAAARAASRDESPSSYRDFNLYDRCVSRAFPNSMMPTNYGNSYTIVQAPGVVAVRYEMIHETRIIPLTPKPALSSAIPQFMGDAQGRWDGDTLVVETRNFRPELAYRDSNPATLKITERFRRTAPDKVEWTVTVDDPETWLRPWTFSMPLTLNPAERVFEYACHEGNMALANMLSAARAEERAAEGSSNTRARPRSAQ